MNTITIDRLSSETWQNLAERARAHNKSIEEEVIEIIERALGSGRGPNWRRAQRKRRTDRSDDSEGG